MGIFSTSTPFDETLDKLTNETNTEMDWGLLISLCDKIKIAPKGPHEFSGAILSRINNKVPHVSMQAITVLDSCINNCGKEFQQEVASQTFTDSLRDIVYHYKNKTVTKRLRYFIRKWAEDFKEDTELSHFVSFYYFLRGEGLDFPETDEDSAGQKKKKEQVSSDPNVVSSQQEADDIAKAIEASLKEEKQRKSYTTTSTNASAPTSSLYPSVLGGSTNTSTLNSSASYSSNSSSVKRKVKALYDFEAAEDNELTFKAGDILSIIDESDANWWKGEGSNGSGLFPANFVTSDLSVEPEPEVGGAKEEEEERESTVKFSDDLEVKEVYQSEPVLSVNEETIDRALTVLQNTDPENTTIDPPELLRDEESCVQMGKLIDRKLEDIDRNHLELSMLNEKILESLKMYDNLMKEMPVYTTQQYIPPTGSHPMQMHPQTMPGYNPNQYYNPGFVSPNTSQEASIVPGPSGGIPKTVGSNQINSPQNVYNPMYQQQQMPNTGMYQPNINTGNSVTDPSMMQQNTFSNAYQTPTPASTNSPKFHGNEQGMSQYQQNNSNRNGYGPNHQSPMHFSTNQAPSQPHM